MESRCGHLELGISLRCASNQKMLKRQRHPLLRWLLTVSELFTQVLKNIFKCVVCSEDF